MVHNKNTKNEIDEPNEDYSKNFILFLASFSILSSLIGLAIGFSFQNVIKELVNFIIMPIIHFFIGKKNPTFAISIGKSKIEFGPFFSALLQFIIIGFVIYFLIWKIFYNKIMKIIKIRQSLERENNRISYQNFLKLQSLDQKIQKTNPYKYDEILPPGNWREVSPTFIKNSMNY